MLLPLSHHETNDHLHQYIIAGFSPSVRDLRELRARGSLGRQMVVDGGRA